jgi:hypothetical protein
LPALTFCHFSFAFSDLADYVDRQIVQREGHW